MTFRYLWLRPKGFQGNGGEKCSNHQSQPLSNKDKVAWETSELPIKSSATSYKLLSQRSTGPAEDHVIKLKPSEP
jgi:hypothetical protein